MLECAVGRTKQIIRAGVVRWVVRVGAAASLAIAVTVLAAASTGVNQPFPERVPLPSSWEMRPLDMPVWLIAGVLSGLGWGFAKHEVLKISCVLACVTFGVWLGGFVLLPDETFEHEYPGRAIGILSVFAITAGLTFLSTLGGVAMSLLARDSISLIRRFASRP